MIYSLPTESATARALDAPTATGWTLTDYLLADLYGAFTGKPHPNRPDPSKKKTASKSSRYAELRAALERQKARLPSPPDV